MHNWLVQWRLLSRNVSGVTLAPMLNIIIHVACLSDDDYFIPLNNNRSDPHKRWHSFKQLAKGAWQLDSLYRYEDSCNLLPWSLSDTALMLDITESAIHISQGILVASDSPHHAVSPTCEYVKYSSRKDLNWNGCSSINLYISCRKVERWVVSQEQQSALNNFPIRLTKTQVGWISQF